MKPDVRDPIFAAWFAVLFVAAFAWLCLVGALYRRLKSHHPALWEEMGSHSALGGLPFSVSGFTVYRLDGTPVPPGQLLSFIYGSRSQQLGDAVLFRICYTMRILCPVFVLGFFALVIIIILHLGVHGVEPAPR
jgi:hypothetical protein